MVCKLRLDSLEFCNICAHATELVLYNCHVFAQSDDSRKQRTAHRDDHSRRDAEHPFRKLIVHLLCLGILRFDRGALCVNLCELRGILRDVVGVVGTRRER